MRGEIILPLKGFNKMNEERVLNGEEEYRNPRNTASGSLKLQDSAEVARTTIRLFIVSSCYIRKKIYNSFRKFRKCKKSWF